MVSDNLSRLLNQHFFIVLVTVVPVLLVTVVIILLMAWKIKNSVSARVRPILRRKRKGPKIMAHSQGNISSHSIAIRKLNQCAKSALKNGIKNHANAHFCYLKQRDSDGNLLLVLRDDQMDMFNKKISSRYQQMLTGTDNT